MCMLRLLFNYSNDELERSLRKSLSNQNASVMILIRCKLSIRAYESRLCDEGIRAFTCVGGKRFIVLLGNKDKHWKIRIMQHQRYLDFYLIYSQLLAYFCKGFLSKFNTWLQSKYNCRFFWQCNLSWITVVQKISSTYCKKTTVFCPSSSVDWGELHCRSSLLEQFIHQFTDGMTDYIL